LDKARTTKIQLQCQGKVDFTSIDASKEARRTLLDVADYLLKEFSELQLNDLVDENQVLMGTTSSSGRAVIKTWGAHNDYFDKVLGIRNLATTVHSQLKSAFRTSLPLPTPSDVNSAVIGRVVETQHNYDADCDEMTKYFEF